MSIHKAIGPLTAYQALTNLRYALGIVIEVFVACLLLSNGYTWTAYVLFATSAIALMIGFFWYLVWFAQRRLTVWYLAGVAELAGIGMWIAGAWFNIDALLWDGLGISLTLPLLCGAWLLGRFLIVRLFGVLLIAVSQLGAAWRGENRPH
jgi:hypothetical protein